MAKICPDCGKKWDGFSCDICDADGAFQTQKVAVYSSMDESAEQGFFGNADQSVEDAAVGHVQDLSLSELLKGRPIDEALLVIADSIGSKGRFSEAEVLRSASEVLSKVDPEMLANLKDEGPASDEDFFFDEPTIEESLSDGEIVKSKKNLSRKSEFVASVLADDGQVELAELVREASKKLAALDKATSELEIRL